MVEMRFDEADGLFIAARLRALLEDIAHGRQEFRPRGHRFDGVEQGQKFEAHLAAPEGKGFDDDDIRAGLVECFEEQLAAAFKERVIDRVALLIGKAGKACIARKQCRQHN